MNALPDPDLDALDGVFDGEDLGEAEDRGFLTETRINDFRNVEILNYSPAEVGESRGITGGAVRSNVRDAKLAMWEQLIGSRVDDLGDAGLSEKQALVVALKERGLKHKEIAELVDVSKSSVDVHSTRVRAKIQQARQLLEATSGVYDEAPEIVAND